MKKAVQKIIVLYNLPEGNMPDDLDTQKSALGVTDGLRKAGYEAEIMGISKDEIGNVKFLPADLVFNLVEWTGRNYLYTVQVIKNLEEVKLPYTGSRAWGYQVSGDKILMKRLLDKYGISTPKWVVDKDSGLEFPLIVKPAYEHCAIGVSQNSVVTNKEDLRLMIYELRKKYDQPVLVEEFIDGDEAQVTVLEKNGRPWVLPPAVFRYQKKAGYWPINTYEAKWNDDSWEAEMSHWVDDVDSKIKTQMQDLAKICYVRLGGRSYPRMDMRINGDKVYVLEVNNNPGIDFDPDSGIAVSAQKAGLGWPGLLKNIVEEAYHDAVVV